MAEKMLAMFKTDHPSIEGIFACRFMDGSAGMFNVVETPASKKLVVVMYDEEMEVHEVPGVHAWYGPMPEAPQ